MSDQRSSTKTLVFMALMMALAMVGTYIIRIPVPATQGYIHLGDSVLILAVAALGWKRGAVSGGVGEALADLLAGYAAFAPVTLVVKILTGIVVGMALGSFAKHRGSRNAFLKFGVPCGIYVLSGAVMVLGYYLAETVMYGSWVVPLVEIPANIIQFAGDSIIAGACIAIFYKTPVKRYFYYQEKH